jgi:hypothetical protein
LLLPALLRLCKGCHVEDISAEWLERFSSRSYYPMDNLLTGEDFSFLSRQPGFDWALYRKFRKDRLRIFRQYLSRMILDFNRLHLVARVLLSQSEHDQSSMLQKLVWLKIRFSLSVMRAEFRYALCCCGVRALCAGELIAELEELAGLIGRLTPPLTA